MQKLPRPLGPVVITGIWAKALFALVVMFSAPGRAEDELPRDP